LGKESENDTLGCDRRKICEALPKQYGSSGKTLEDGAWVSSDPETAWIFRQRTRGRDNRESVVAVPCRAAGLSDRSAFRTVVAGGVQETTDR